MPPPPPPKETAESKPMIRIGKVESVDLYQIKDSELDLLEKGSPADLQLVFAIFLLTLAFSGFCTLTTATFTDNTTKTLFIVVTVVGIILGAYFLIAWLKNRTSLKKVASQIRQRIPQNAAEQAPIIAGSQSEQSTTKTPQG